MSTHVSQKPARDSKNAELIIDKIERRNQAAIRSKTQKLDAPRKKVEEAVLAALPAAGKDAYYEVEICKSLNSLGVGIVRKAGAGLFKDEAAGKPFLFRTFDGQIRVANANGTALDAADFRTVKVQVEVTETDGPPTEKSVSVAPNCTNYRVSSITLEPEGFLVETSHAYDTDGFGQLLNKKDTLLVNSAEGGLSVLERKSVIEE